MDGFEGQIFQNKSRIFFDQFFLRLKGKRAVFRQILARAPWQLKFAIWSLERAFGHFEAKTDHFDVKTGHHEAKTDHFEAKTGHFEAQTDHFEATLGGWLNTHPRWEF